MFGAGEKARSGSVRPEAIVFLDFDGVLNCADGPIGKRGLLGLCCERIAMIDTLCRVTTAAVVVSSTWRLDQGVSDLRGLLKDHGFTGMVLDKTPYLPGSERGDEIACWLSNNDWRKPFVIIDDDADMGDLKPYLVKTSFTDGLQLRHIEWALDILRAAWPNAEVSA